MDRKRGSLAYKRSQEDYPPSTTLMNRDKVEALAYGESRGLREPHSIEWLRNTIRVEKNATNVFISHHSEDREKLTGLVVYISGDPPVASPTVVERVYALCAEKHEDAAMELLGDELDDMLRAGKATSANQLLASLDPTRLSPSVSLVALTITSHAERASLPARAVFLTRAEVALREELGADRAEALLARRR